MKKVISLLLTAVLIIGMLPLSAVAASTPEEALGELDIYSGGYSMNYLAVNGKVQTQCVHPKDRLCGGHARPTDPL